MTLEKEVNSRISVRRIGGLVALGVWGLAMGGFLWLDPLPPGHDWRKSRDQRRGEFRQIFAYRATVVLQFGQPGVPRMTGDKVVSSTEVRSSVLNLDTFAQILQSQRIGRRVLVSWNEQELALVMDRDFWRTGRTSLRGISVGIDQAAARLEVTAVHRDREVALMLARRYCREFFSYLSENSSERTEFAVEYLKRRSHEVSRSIAQAEQAFAEAQSVNDMDQINRLDHELAQARATLKTLEERLAQVTDPEKAHELPLKEVETRVEKVFRWSKA